MEEDKEQDGGSPFPMELFLGDAIDKYVPVMLEYGMVGFGEENYEEDSWNVHSRSIVVGQRRK